MVICRDELGPEAAKSYRGQEVVRPSAEHGADGDGREFLEAFPCPSCEYLSLWVPVD
jgi:hypothetical protein